VNSAFWEVAESVHHPGMGTENVAVMLYALVKMLRPSHVLAVGLGYSTLFLLQALADSCEEALRDYELMQGNTLNPARREVLHEIEADRKPKPGRLVAIDDFSDDGGRLKQLLKGISHLHLDGYMELHREKYDAGVLERLHGGFQLVWVDCGHQLEYIDLTNRVWPLLHNEGGVLGMHYTYVDVAADFSGRLERIVIPGPWLNEVRRQQLQAGLDARFELLSILEPHKFRQGSLTLLRKVDHGDQCRETSLAQENASLYGVSGPTLSDLNADDS
jgi:predicted O-methyltransferase YrrM